MDLDYTKSFEYAREMVRAFISNEEAIHTRNLEDLYGEQSWLANFFNFNLNQLSHKEVEKQIDIIMTLESEQKPYNAALARIRSLYSSLVMSTGIDFINELEENCVRSLTYLNDNDRSIPRGNVYKLYRRIMNKHPELILSALGNQDFSNRRVNFVHKHNSH